jgi:putative heme-binding domain-containing protein
MKRNAFLLLLLMFLATVLSEASSQNQTEDLTRGKSFYIGQCALCHGIGGAGGRGPNLNKSVLPRTPDDNALFRTIKFGINGTEMPGSWALTDDEVRLVVAYVRSLGRVETTKLPGDPANGKRLYETKGACASCHIIHGEGASIGPELTRVGGSRSPDYLRKALTDPGADTPDGYLVIRVTTRDGKTLRGVRVNEDSFTIQLRDAANQYRSFRKADLKELKKEFGASTMPNYKDSMTATEIDDLVAYLSNLRGEK